MQTVLTIAGFDPSSGAGVTADLMVFAAHGLFGASCITALTVQSTLGVKATHAVAADIVRATLDCLDEDLPAAGVKVGMLATVANVAAVADFLTRIRARHASGEKIPVVLDPVMRSSSGRELIDRAGVELLRERLLPLVDWVTPNLDELWMLTGQTINGRGDIAEAARILQSHTSGLNVLATGGHMDPPDDLVLTSDGRTQWLHGRRIHTKATHGTGCALSSALLSRLVLGDAAVPAASSAKEYVAHAMQAAEPIGHGHGPLDHLWNRRAIGTSLK